MNLNLHQTKSIKGIAVLLLLWHHLYYTHPEYGHLVFQSAITSKVCVHLFLILSGYGLFYSMQKYLSVSSACTLSTGISPLLHFYYSRFKALMPKYWIIFLLGVSVSILVFKKMPSDVFSSFHPNLRLLMQFLGLHMLKFEGYGYNPTWWFMTTIILLYAVFSLIYVLLDVMPVFSFIALLFFFTIWSIPSISIWGVPFIVGVFCAKINTLHSNKKQSKSTHIIYWKTVGIFLSVGYLLWAFVSGGILLGGIPVVLWQTLQAFCIIMFFLLCFSNNVYLNRILGYLGEHSYNIFLLHTFLNHWIFFRFIYDYKYSPLWALPLLVILSLLCSIGVNAIYHVIFHRTGLR